jgi:hypothetical protein
MTNRITDPTHVSTSEVRSILANGLTPIIQFSTDAAPDLLRQVNDLCREFGVALEVRFYGFYGGAFDAEALQHLPDVANLSVDCLTAIRNEDRLADLPRLTKVGLGVYELSRHDILTVLPLSQLTALSVGENAKRDIDLAPIARCTALSELRVVGHTRNIEAVAEPKRLANLRLNSIAKTQCLNFVSSMRGLRTLGLLLGGRADIDEVRHEALGALNVDRVRGFERLGSLARFPALRHLRIEDEARLKAIDLSDAPLETVTLVNCKTLETLAGATDLTALRSLRISRCPDLDIEALASATWPPTLEILALYSGLARRDTPLRAALDQRGYREF